VPEERRVIQRAADLRYRRQAYELTVPIPEGEVTAASMAALAEAFHAKHEQTYGHANRAEGVHMVNLRVTALGRLPPLALRQATDPAAARHGERAAWFAATGAAPCPVLWRDGLVPGTVLAGPAIIQALDSTTVLPPGWALRVDAEGYLRMRRNAA
jgi:N-methylhydantoinase A